MWEIEDLIGNKNNRKITLNSMNFWAGGMAQPLRAKLKTKTINSMNFHNLCLMY